MASWLSFARPVRCPPEVRLAHEWPSRPSLAARTDSRSARGVLTYLEYHYSGFGAARPEDILPLFMNPEFQRRYLQGDTQILGRHAIALLANYEFSPELIVAGQWLQSPADGSGVVAPSATLTFGDRLSVLATLYVPYGSPPIAGTLTSEYGTAALSGLIQLRVYD
jgi:hypothetical protein